MLNAKYLECIARNLDLKTEQVEAAISLVTGGASIPFVAQYRRDATGNLTEEQLESIEEQRLYFTALRDRTRHVVEQLEAQKMLSDALREQLENTLDKEELEDLYAPYKKRRRTKATVAREKGLAPLADIIWACSLPEGQTLESVASEFVRSEKAVHSTEEALEGAHAILVERLSADKDMRRLLRSFTRKNGKVTASLTKQGEGQKTGYDNFRDFSESVSSIPSHRFLAIARGVKEGVLRMEIAIDQEAALEEMMAHARAGLDSEPEPATAERARAALNEAYDVHLRALIEAEVQEWAATRAEQEAVRVFCSNLENILLTPPLGKQEVLGFVVVGENEAFAAAVDPAGALTKHCQFPLPAPGEALPEDSPLWGLVDGNTKAWAIGNSTGARAASGMVRQVISQRGPEEAFYVFVNEGGLPGYAESEPAAAEMPDVSPGVRKAVAVARRLQDPLSEYVKVDPRHIGVGQYHHDVNQKRLRDALHKTVGSCVSRVGVQLNDAGPALLEALDLVTPPTAANIVAKREEVGGFTAREQLIEVPGVGPKVYEQCAGFLRVENGANPLDRTRIHPAQYPVVERMAEAAGVAVAELVGNREAVNAIDLSAFENEECGPYMVRFIRRELLRPGHDIRAAFQAPRFDSRVQAVSDLETGMVLDGVVTNVTDFGVFVDVGAGQDGLVHLSEMANRFVRDPRTVARVGDIVKVKVIKVDPESPRISLSIKQAAPKPPPRRPRRPRQDSPEGSPQEGERPAAMTDDRHARPSRPRRDDQTGQQGGPPRRQDRKPKRGAPKGGPRRGEPKQPTVHTSTATGGEPINTQLADQLAKLREKLEGK